MIAMAAIPDNSVNTPMDAMATVMPSASAISGEQRLDAQARPTGSTVSDKFSGDDRGMFGPGVSQRVDDFGLLKAGSAELFQECTCILCTGDSREPIGTAGLEACGQC